MILTKCSFIKHVQVLQLSMCGLDQNVVWALHMASESGTVFAGPAGPSMPPLQSHHYINT